jgi:protein-S-isoprenylcysteine O-methyltransferase Ste14
MLMERFYEWFFPVVWAAYLLYWRAVAYNVKTTQRLEPLASRIFRTVLFLAAIALLLFQKIPIPWLYWQFYPYSLLNFWGGAAITVAGLLFAIWARRHLGRNWSHSVTIKADHQLIETGPYALVRHPIYTGLLTGFLGTAIAVAQPRGVIAFALIFIALWVKLRLEEAWMRENFGAAYEEYSRRSAMLVPYVL